MEGEIRILHVDSDSAFADRTASALKHEDGSFIVKTATSVDAGLERQNERLEEFASVLSHDLRNPLNVAEGRLELARAEHDSENLRSVARSLDRVEALIEDILTVACDGRTVENPEPVALAAVVEDAWRHVETKNATLDVVTDRTVYADNGRLQQLFENLIRNGVEHGSTSSRTQSDDTVEHGSTSNRPQVDNAVEHGTRGDGAGASPERSGEQLTITVGDLDGGFYFEDDGVGIPDEKRNDVFDAGYSTAQDGTGFGLSIVEEITKAHGWTIAATEGSAGGARFEIMGVETPNDQ